MKVRTVAIVATAVFVIGGSGTLATISGSGLLDDAQGFLGSTLLQSPCLPELGGGVQAGGAGSIANLDRAQVRNVTDIARAAVEVAKRRGLDGEQLTHVLTTAYATALVESDLRNLPSRANPASLAFDYDTYPGGGIPAGDHSSVGLFQQLDAWGPMSVRMDRRASTTMFLTGGRQGQPGLLDIPGWQTMPPGVLAQRVQVSAFPLRYAERVPRARAIAAVVLGTRTTSGGGSGTLASGLLSGGSGCELASSNAPTKIGKCPPANPAFERGLTPDGVAILRCGLGDFPMIRSYGCLATSGHVPGSDHYTGRACDFMIPGQATHDTKDGVALGNSMAAYFKDHAREFGVTYIIWHGRIWNSARASEGWRTYRHPSGSSNWTLLHMDHVHVSVKGQAGVFGWGA